MDTNSPKIANQSQKQLIRRLSGNNAPLERVNHSETEKEENAASAAPMKWKDKACESIVAHLAVQMLSVRVASLLGYNWALRHQGSATKAQSAAHFADQQAVKISVNMCQNKNMYLDM